MLRTKKTSASQNNQTSMVWLLGLKATNQNRALSLSLSLSLSPPTMCTLHKLMQAEPLGLIHKAPTCGQVGDEADFAV